MYIIKRTLKKKNKESFKRANQLLVLVALGLMVVACDCQTCATFSDGCSTPVLPQYKPVFKAACDKHDVCYGCGASYEHSKMACDMDFHKNMTSICGALPNRTISEKLKRTECFDAVSPYFTAVRVSGKLLYRSSSNPLSYCKMSWVRSCLP